MRLYFTISQKMTTPCPLYYDFEDMLDCRNKGFTSLDEIITTNTRISEGTTEVLLGNNNITRLQPNAFSQATLCNLSVLKLNHNNISEIELNAFSCMGSLRQLHLEVNRLTTLKIEMFLGMEALVDLYLSRNLIRSIEPKSFLGLENLKGLYLDRNHLHSLQAGTFTGLDMGTIDYIDMSNNIITNMDAHSMDFIDFCEAQQWTIKLYLHKNNLKILSDSVFGCAVFNDTRPVQGQLQLSLSDNPLNCSTKHLCWLSEAENNISVAWIKNKGPNCKPLCHTQTTTKTTIKINVTKIGN